MRRSFLLALLLAFLLPTAVPAATCPGEKKAEEAAEPTDADDQDAEAAPGAKAKWKTGLRNVGSDGLYMVTFPKRITKRGVIMTSAFGVGLAGLILLDQEIYDDNRGKERLDGLHEIEQLGGFYQTHLAVLATYGSGKLAHHEPTIETSRAMLEALLFTDLFVGAGKAAFGRDAPDGDVRASDWFSYEDSGRFPSGHTARAFTLATVLAERHGKVAAWIGYPLATLVGLSLIDSEDHWASDTFAGAALGYVVGRAVVRRRAQRSGRRVRFEPVVQQDGGMGMMVRITIPKKSARRGR